MGVHHHGEYGRKDGGGGGNSLQPRLGFIEQMSRMSEQACLVQTPTLPGLVSLEISSTLLRLSLSVCVLCCV